MGMIRGIVISVLEGMIKRFSASGRSDETIEDREYFQHYGFTSRPKTGAELIIVNEGNHYVAVASDDRRYRVAVEDGEVCLYTDEGDRIHFKRNRTIEIVSGNRLKATVENDVEITSKTALVTASVSCQVNSPLINLGGDRGGLKAICDERLISWLGSHTHDGGATPDQSLTASDVCTAITKAG